jgi:triosephosphate isomerase
MKLLIVANWKMNPQTLAEAKRVFNSVKRGVRRVRSSEVVICPPFVFLSELKTKGSGLKLGAQDCFWEEGGAYTGEISPLTLKSLGCQYVILGHSERRKYQKETDETINKKIKLVLRERLKPILCVDNIGQVKKDLKGIGKKEIRNLIIAYEPLFAIGTGRSCSSKRAERMRVLIQRKIKSKSAVLYGGSVKSKNAENYTKEAGFQGLLVGGASLKPKEFVRLVKKVDLIAKTC